jgi:hypothetical protein
MEKFFISVLIIFAFIVFSYNLEIAFGCSCGYGDLGQSFEYSDSVFLGTIEEITLSESGRNEVEVKPIRFWKGNQSENIIVQTARDEGRCGFPFVQNQTYLIFATKQENDVLSTGLCAFTQNEKQASEEIFLMNSNLIFLWTGWLWLMLFVGGAVQLGFQFLIPMLVIVGLTIYFLILYRKKLFSRKS